MTRTSKKALTFVTAAALLPFIAIRAAPAQDLPAAAPSDAAQTYVDSLRRARDSLMAAGDFDGALEPAQLVIDVVAENPENSPAGDEIMLAVILAELGRFDDAETRLLDTIQTLQEDEGPVTSAAVTPLRLLGRTYIRARRFPQAVTALTEARSLSRRTAGLFNVDQADILDDLTTAHLGIGDTQTARDLQIERLETAQRQYGEDDPQVIPYHHHLADYYARSRLLGSAREQYDAALEIAQTAGDEEQILIALRSAAALELQMGPSRSTTERLREALAQTPAGGHEAGLAYAVLADAALLEENTDLAEEHYAHAWRLLAEAGRVDPAEFFADPAVIRFVAPASDVDVARRSLPYSWGTIAIEFDVAANGRVASITGVGAEPAELMEAAYVERVNAAWFRPALVDGRPSDAEGVVLTHYFRYYVEPEDDDD